MSTTVLQTLAHIGNSQARRNELGHRLAHLDRRSRIQLLALALDDPYPMIRHDVAEAFQAELKKRDNTLGSGSDKIAEFLEAIASGRPPSHRLTQFLDVPRDLLPHRTPRARITACVALEASPRPKKTAEVIRPLLRAESSDLRYQALIATYRLVADSPRLYDVVVDGLRDADAEIAVVATQIAVKFGWADLIPQFLEVRARLGGEDRIQITFSVGELIDNSQLAPTDLPAAARGDMIAECVDALSHEPHTASAIQTLANLEATEAVEELVTVTKRWFAHPILKVEAAAALIDLGHPRGEEYIGRALDSRRRDARGYALRIIGDRRIERYFSHLVDVATEDVYHADTATLAIADFGGDQSHQILGSIADDHPHPDVRRLAQDAMAHRLPDDAPDLNTGALAIDPASFDATLDR